MTIADTFVALMNLVQGPVATHLRTDAGVAHLLRPLVNRLLPNAPTWVVVRSGAVLGLV
jgi:hypothetical protein